MCPCLSCITWCFSSLVTRCICKVVDHLLTARLLVWCWCTLVPVIRSRIWITWTRDKDTTWLWCTSAAQPNIEEVGHGYGKDVGTWQCGNWFSYVLLKYYVEILKVDSFSKLQWLANAKCGRWNCRSIILPSLSLLIVHFVKVKSYCYWCLYDSPIFSIILYIKVLVFVIVY